ncbi:hypothetical protein BDN72DRAFT_895386 [Pluteus cervinus]|uniref:Uncharacterized protein n=1 Tax=Pluteus cervinus TaxID=181527 RepID=A0ACD3B2M4_9AGAR|nr:hypothetical protein BDN72DRAFT_895386 [Pluteus cervinus]
MPPDALPEDIPTLVAELNLLVRNLRLPFVLESPTDLTPSLLLAILERLVAQPIPLTEHLRYSLSSSSGPDEKSYGRIQITKLFLGVLLDCTLLDKDVGLTDIDPRKLANGDWEEVVFIGQLLCWIARKAGVLQFDDDDHIRSNGTRRHRSDQAKLLPDAPIYPLSEGFTSHSNEVRYFGFIKPVDEDSELESFEANRSMLSALQGRPSGNEDPQDFRSQTQLCERTLTLLEERARLLNELAKLQTQ